MSHTGTLKCFAADRGFGFIANEAGGDVFVHARQFRNARIWNVAKGQRLQFEIVPARQPGKTQADNIVLLEPILDAPIPVYAERQDDREAYRALAEAEFPRRD